MHNEGNMKMGREEEVWKANREVNKRGCQWGGGGELMTIRPLDKKKRGRETGFSSGEKGLLKANWDEVYPIVERFPKGEKGRRKTRIRT